MADKARITITLRDKHLEVVNALAKSSNKKPGDIVAELIKEVLEGITPALEAENEAQAMRAILRVGLNKLGTLLDESIG